MLEFEPLGADPLFPGGGELYKFGGFYLNTYHGGPATREWIDKNFEARPDDIYVASYPKTGTTWAQEMVYVIGNDLDFKKARSESQFQRFPYLETPKQVEMSAVDKLEIPRFIKSHYPYSLLPKSIIDKKCKIVYTIRNPKDTLVSYYHFAIKNKVIDYNGDFETFFKLFIQEKKILYSPYSKHVLEFWERRHQGNILILQYEDMKKDTVPAVRSIAEFLGKTLTEEQVQQVVMHCHFDNMSKNPTTNREDVLPGFMRKGQIGDWKNYFTDEMNKEMEDFVRRHFAGTGLNFQYDS